MLNLEAGTCDHSMLKMQDGTCHHGMLKLRDGACGHGMLNQEAKAHFLAELEPET